VEIVKRCGCCGTEYSELGWESLPKVGEFTHGGETTQYRNCPCGSTIGRAWCVRCLAEITTLGVNGVHVCESRSVHHDLAARGGSL